MTKFILRRLLISIVILFFVMFIIFLIMYSLPSNYIETVARQLSQKPNASATYEEWLATLKDAYGFEDNIFVGFFKWIGRSLTGNFGDSWYYGGKVIDKFNSTIWTSFWMGLISFILEMIIAVPLGIVAARKQYSTADVTITVVALIGISLPTFFLATLLKLVFSIRLGWFDISGMVGRDHLSLSAVGQFFDICAHMVLPILTLTLVSIGGMMRYTRTNMLEVLNSDYIRTARAKGVPESRVINYHAFRNTLIPIVTIIGGSLPGLFGGALITETLFAIDGIGYASYTAMMQGDIPFTMFYLTFMAILTLIGTLIADILYAVVDPRVRVN